MDLTRRGASLRILSIAAAPSVALPGVEALGWGGVLGDVVGFRREETFEWDVTQDSGRRTGVLGEGSASADWVKK